MSVLCPAVVTALSRQVKNAMTAMRSIPTNAPMHAKMLGVETVSSKKMSKNVTTVTTWIPMDVPTPVAMPHVVMAQFKMVSSNVTMAIVSIPMPAPTPVDRRGVVMVSPARVSYATMVITTTATCAPRSVDARFAAMDSYRLARHAMMEM